MGLLKFGNLSISAIKLGSSTVSKVYMGSTLVYNNDTTPPTTPGKPTVTTLNGSNAVSWTASTDASEITYNLWASPNSDMSSGFVISFNQPENLFSDSSYTKSVWRYYQVQAADSAGNHSAFSAITGVRNTTTPMGI